MMTDAARLASRECMASAIQPESTGPIAWPTATATVNTAIAGPHDGFGSVTLMSSVIVAGAENNPRPKKNAERIIADGDVLNSGMAAPTLIVALTAANRFAAGHLSRGTRQTSGAIIADAPSVPHMNATTVADAPRETIHAMTN